MNVERKPCVACPKMPQSFAETGISEKIIESLILKLLKQEGKLDDKAIMQHLCLPLSIIREFIKSLKEQKLIDTPVPLKYDLTTIGRQRVREIILEDSYVGPAPVSFEAYSNMVIEQAKFDKRVPFERVLETFKGFEFKDEMLMALKEGFNSMKPILLYGPPGNGKTLITEKLSELISNLIYIPYAIEFAGRIIKFFDPAVHSPVDENIANSYNPAGLKPDKRWLLITPPLVIVGTEFRVRDFEISCDGGLFEATPLLKANNGIFVIDDFGRQLDEPNMILNQFIYPLESKMLILSLPGGSRMRAPYRQRLFLSTNLNKEEIIDDAFNRRLLYQFLIDRPSPKMWKKIFINHYKKIAQNTQEELEYFADKLLQWFQEDGRVYRACDPRDLGIMLDATLDEGEQLKLDENLLRNIYLRYPIAAMEQAKDYSAYSTKIMTNTEED